MQYVNSGAISQESTPVKGGDMGSPRVPNDGGPPRVPSPPMSYGIAHSYGPSRNSSFAVRRPSPPQPPGSRSPMTSPRSTPLTSPRSPLTSPRSRPSRTPDTNSNSQTSPSVDGSINSYHYEPNIPQDLNSYNPHLRDYPSRDYQEDYPPPTRGLILPLADHGSPHRQNGSSPDSLSEVSHTGRYSPSQNNSESPCTTGTRNSPESHDHYTNQSHDSDLDEEIPMINPYAIMELEGKNISDLGPYKITDIPRVMDYPASEHSS